VAELEGVQLASPTMAAFVQTVRQYTRDHPQLNRLIAGEESGDRMIQWAVLDAVDDFNGTPHFTSFSIEDLIQKNLRSLMLRMTVIALLESVGLLQTRNHINYSNGGVNVGVNDKTPMIMQWLQYYKGFTEQRKQQVKVAINIESILGPHNPGIHSELWAINASYLSY
jgi:hypothetical protein